MTFRLWRCFLLAAIATRCSCNIILSFQILIHSPGQAISVSLFGNLAGRKLPGMLSSATYSIWFFFKISLGQMSQGNMATSDTRNTNLILLI